MNGATTGLYIACGAAVGAAAVVLQQSLAGHHQNTDNNDGTAADDVDSLADHIQVDVVPNPSILGISEPAVLNAADATRPPENVKRLRENFERNALLRIRTLAERLDLSESENKKEIQDLKYELDQVNTEIARNTEGVHSIGETVDALGKWVTDVRETQDKMRQEMNDITAEALWVHNNPSIGSDNEPAEVEEDPTKSPADDSNDSIAIQPPAVAPAAAQRRPPVAPGARGAAAQRKPAVPYGAAATRKPPVPSGRGRGAAIPVPNTLRQRTVPQPPFFK